MLFIREVPFFTETADKKFNSLFSILQGLDKGVFHCHALLLPCCSHDLSKPKW